MHFRQDPASGETPAAIASTTSDGGSVISRLEQWIPASLSQAVADRIGWALVIVLIIMQYGMFRQFMTREVIWAFPPNNDQLSYLEQSYQTYEHILTSGVKKGLDAGTKARFGHFAMNASGAMIHLQAAVLFLMIGASRLSALTLNFIYFALFQIALVYTLRWLSGRWSVALVGLGLLLSAATPFFWAGGLSDFRMDFIAFCLYGVFLCLVIRSEVFESWPWSIVVGLGASLLISFRFITLVYLGGVMGLFTLALAAQWIVWRRDPARRPRLERQTLGLGIAGSIILILIGPVIYHHRQAIQEYYVVGHVTGTEPGIRRLEQGIKTAWDSVKYYPVSLRDDHVGPHYAKLVTRVLGIALLLFGLREWQTRKLAPVAPLHLWSAAGFLVLAMLVPLAALTRDESKSPVVANVMVGPLTWWVIFAALYLAGIYRTTPRKLAPDAAFALVGAWVLFMGVLNQMNAYSHRTEYSRRRADVEGVNQLYDRVGVITADMGWKLPQIANDCNCDFLNHKVAKILIYERHGYLQEYGQTMANRIFNITEPEAIEELQRSDFAMLTKLDNVPEFLLPFDADMEKLKPHLFDFCRKNMVELDHLHVMDRDLTLFIRPTVGVKAAADGWVTREGMTVVGLPQVLRRYPKIELCGENMEQYLHKAPHVTATFPTSDGRSVEVPATLVNSGRDYCITLNVNPAELKGDEPVKVQLTFDTYFVPRQVNGNPDDRQLVMRSPVKVTVSAN